MDADGAKEAKSILSQLLERVARGERITITRHGVPVAVLSPAQPVKSEPVGETIEKLVRFRQGRRLDSSELREMGAEGRD